MIKEIIKYSKSREVTFKEIVKKFNIPEKRYSTLRRRLNENNISLKDSRGRKKIDL